MRKLEDNSARDLRIPGLRALRDRPCLLLLAVGDLIQPLRGGRIASKSRFGCGGNRGARATCAWRRRVAQRRPVVQGTRASSRCPAPKISSSIGSASEIAEDLVEVRADVAAGPAGGRHLDARPSAHRRGPARSCRAAAGWAPGPRAAAAREADAVRGPRSAAARAAAGPAVEGAARRSRGIRERVRAGSRQMLGGDSGRRRLLGDRPVGGRLLLRHPGWLGSGALVKGGRREVGLAASDSWERRSAASPSARTRFSKPCRTGRGIVEAGDDGLRLRDQLVAQLGDPALSLGHEVVGLAACVLRGSGRLGPRLLAKPGGLALDRVEDRGDAPRDLRRHRGRRSVGTRGGPRLPWSCFLFVHPGNGGPETGESHISRPSMALPEASTRCRSPVQAGRMPASRAVVSRRAIWPRPGTARSAHRAVGWMTCESRSRLSSSPGPGR